MNTTLTANITSACGATVRRSRSVESGVLDSDKITIHPGYQRVPVNSSVLFSVMYAESSCGYLDGQWVISPSGYSTNNPGFSCPGSLNGSRVLTFHSPGQYAVRVRLRNSCGWSETSNPISVNVY